MELFMKSFVSAVLILGCLCPIAPAGQAPAPSAGKPAGTQQTQQAPQEQAKKDDCGCEGTAPDLLAEVNGVKIKLSEVDEPIKLKVQELQQQVSEARTRELDMQVNSKLLEAEA